MQSNLSVAQIFFLLDEYQEKHPELHHPFLLTLNDRLRAICQTQRGWLSHTGLIAKRLCYAGLSLPLITQEALCEEALDTQIKTVGFTKLTVDALFKDVKEEFDETPFLDHAYLDFLKKTLACLTAVSNGLHERMQITRGVAFAIDKKFFSLANEKIVQVQKLGGRIYPFSQDLDPLVGQSKGDCYGFTMAWAEEIQENGIALKLPRENRHILGMQAGIYGANLPYSTFKTISEFCHSEIYCYQSDLRPTLTKLINRLSEQFTYQLSMQFLHSRDGHSMGIRRILGSSEIEFFDPNLGLVIFHDPSLFCYWLADHLCDDFHRDMVKGGYITLYELGKQSWNARASIPDLMIDTKKHPHLALDKLTEFNKLKTIPAQFAEPKKQHSAKKSPKKWYKNLCFFHPHEKKDKKSVELHATKPLDNLQSIKLK